MKRTVIYALGFLLLTQFSLTAQENIVYGKVTVYNEVAIKNATVFSKKTKKTTMTDSLGYFKIESKTKDKLSITAKGFEKYNVKIENIQDSVKVNLRIAKDETNIQLAADAGHIYYTDIDFVTKKFNTKPLYSLGYPNTVSLITGKFPKVEFIDNEFIIRGIKSLDEDTKKGAVIVINGILSDEGSLKSLVVTSIKNIKIVTGMAATKYGPGSGNGVILVELY